MKKGFVVTAIIAVIVLAAPLPAQQIEYVGSTLWSGINDVKVRGDYAYCVFYNGLAVFDVSEDSIISMASKLYLGGGSKGIDIDNNFAYICDGTSGLQVVNITNPYNPIVVGNCIASGNFLRIQVSNHIAYIADAIDGIIIFDVSEPGNPYILGSFNYDHYSISELYIDNNRGYLILHSRNSPQYLLKIIDISEPNAITELGEYEPLYSHLEDIVVDGDYAYLATSYEGLLILNVANPAHITAVGTYNTQSGTSISLSGNYAYITSSTNDGLYVVDISQPRSPSLLGTYRNGGVLSNIVVDSNYIYLTSGYFSNIEKISVLNPASPSRCAIYVGTSNTLNLSISDSYAYLASLTGLKIVDLTDPSHPLDLFKENIGFTIGNNIDVSGQFAYLIDSFYGFRIINVADPANPNWIGGDDGLGGSGGIFINNNYAYIAVSSSLQIIDVTNARNPELTGTYITPGVLSNIYIRGNFAFITYNHGLSIINISNPANPLPIGNITLPGVPSSVFVLGDYAFIADDYLGLKVINISDPASPISVGNFDTPGYAKDVFAIGEYVFIADYYSIQVINVTDPTNPTYVTHYYTPGFALGIFVSGNYIYVADDYSFLILRFSPTNVEDPKNLPSSLSLSPNYPNPFNSSTTIRYNLPTESPVTIDIYDILGRKVQTLLDVKELAGSHQVNWNADDLPSGAYFARLKAGQQSQTMKMILMK
jgi:hypothetical protein